MFRHWIWRSMMVLMSISLWAQAQDEAVASDHRVALVIGNKAYTHLDTLHSPVYNADSMAVALSQYGFSVIQDNDLNLERMEKAVLDFHEKLKKSQVGLFYYSGHSIQIGDQNYFIPVDADIQEDYEVKHKSLSMQSVLDTMKTTGAQTNILILDASWMDISKGNKDVSMGGLAVQQLPIDAIASYGRLPENGTDSNGPNNSPYTETLLEVMRESAERKDVEAIFSKVRIKLSRTNMPTNTSKLSGKFYFAHPQ